MELRALARDWLPPGGVRLGRRVLAWLRPSQWEYVAEGWRGGRARIRGWDEESVAAAEADKWQEFTRLLGGTGPLGISHEARRPGQLDYAAHNTIMAFAYVLALAARGKQRLSVLDWGGGLGHYYLLARALVPDLELEYHCKDLSIMCRRGRELLPAVRFHDDIESCLGRRYDVAAQLVAMAGFWLYITRTPIVLRTPSFVVVQRPHRLDYRTEYLGWFLNRRELIDALQALGVELAREFLIDERPFVPRAPEQCEYRGFLWRPAAAPGAGGSRGNRE